MEPLAPALHHPVTKASESAFIARDPVVLIMAPPLDHQLLMLPRHLRMAVATAPAVDPLQGSAQSPSSRLTLAPPTALPGASPVVGKSQQPKRARPRRGLVSRTLGAVGGTREANQPRLLGMERQAVFPHALGEDRHDPVRVLFQRADHGDIIRKPVELRLSGESWLHLVRTPLI